MKIAIVGATGAVGAEMVRLLEERKFPVKTLRCFASSRSLGKTISFRGTQIPIEALVEGSLNGIDLALFSAGKRISMAFALEAAKGGCIVIDNSSAFRMDPHTPLIVPEINIHALQGHSGVISSPNCIAAILLMPLAPLHRRFKIRRIVASTYQAASGAGATAMEELLEETKAALEGASFQRTVMPYPYAFNLFPHNAPMTPSYYNDEEVKVVQEVHKILEDSSVRMAVTCVRVPVLRAHAICANVEFAEPACIEEVRRILSSEKGVRLLEDWENNRFATPLDASGQNDVFVGRIRKDVSHPCALDFWIVGDQLLKGAALNAVQIAESVVLR